MSQKCQSGLAALLWHSGFHKAAFWGTLELLSAKGLSRAGAPSSKMVHTWLLAGASVPHWLLAAVLVLSSVRLSAGQLASLQLSNVRERGRSEDVTYELPSEVTASPSAVLH